MQHQLDQAAAAISPTTEDMLRIWYADRCVQDSSAAVYLQWIKRFRTYSAGHGLDEHTELTRDGAHRFIAWYAGQRRLDARRLGSARTALYALSRVYQAMGLNPPMWQAPRPPPPPASALLEEYANHLVRRRGNPATTVHKKLDHIGKLFDHLAVPGKTWSSMALTDIDDFLIACAQRYARSTVADIAGSVRSFTRFLLATGRISIELAESVISPVQPKFERPRRALPWEDVLRLLRSVDTSTARGLRDHALLLMMSTATARGLRDHALLLMMSTYGFGAGEVIRLQFQDIDWSAATLKVVRPKTGVAFTLPLLPAVAKALAFYLRDGRPPNTPTRHVFVRMKMPFSPLSASSAVRHIIVKHAKAAGLDAPYLGSHVLRHSNAARQVDLGIRPQVLSDLLGHRDPESISAYVRIATETLRDISLPVAGVTTVTADQLARDAQEFLRFKRAMGIAYWRGEFVLNGFLRFVAQHWGDHGEVALDDAITRWCARIAGRKAVTVANEFGVVRQLCLYRRRRDPSSYVPEHALAPVKESVFLPYIFSHDEVHRILAAATSHHGRFIWASMLRALILVLYCTGLRLGEAVRLRTADVDLDRGALMIQRSKGRSRIAAIRADLVAELRRYAAARRRLVGERRRTDPETFFLRLDASALTVGSASESIRHLLRNLGIKPSGGRVGARPYEFRHAFAVHRLTAWANEGVDIHAKLPLLSAYLGHQNIIGTEVYLKATPQLLELASSRFEQHLRGSRPPQ